MSDAPFLTAVEVRQELDRIFGRAHRSHLVALYGRGTEGAVEALDRRWDVIPTSCELELRERLPRPEEGDPARVYLVDWVSDVLPIDVACRLAGAQLHHVARDARLRALFGARQIDPGIVGTALGRVLLGGTLPPPRKIQGIRLTRDEAWQTVLASRLRMPETALASVGALLAWASGDDGGPSFASAVASEELWRGARGELVEWLRQRLGEPAIAIFECWERNQAGALLEVLPLLEAARGASDAYWAGRLSGQLSAWFGPRAGAVRASEDALAASATLDEAMPADARARLALLERAQARAVADDLAPLTAVSARLPGGHAARERALAGAIDAFLAERDADRWRDLENARAALEAHALDAALRDEQHREARRSLSRLALWLANRVDRRAVGARWQPTVDLARTYSEEGGHLEWARQQVRGLRGAHEALLAAARALDVAVAATMRDDHRAFAEAYVAWLAAEKPSAEALPIEEVARLIIDPFLAGHPRRKLLVVLMDGMSHAAAAQLLARLSESKRWAPIAWRRENWRGSLPLPPVVAAAPTLTEVSRSAFFAGRFDRRFGPGNSEPDSKRWAANKPLAKYLDDDAPLFFVRKDLRSGHELDPKLRDAIVSDARLVAAVVNAIDEDLDGSGQVAKDYRVSPILPLEALLSFAEDGERVVLLIADHGHVLADATATVQGRRAGKRPGGARWRALAEDEAPAPEEIVLPSSCWAPRGYRSVATLWDPAVVNDAADYGAHGGLSLSEAVCPAILIAPDWLEREALDDAALASRPFAPPDWWALRPRRAPGRPSAPARAAILEDAPPAAPPKPAQLSLMAEVAPRAAVGPEPNALVQALRGAPVFQAMVEGRPASEIDRVLSWVGALADAGGSMPAADFAAAAGVRTHLVAGTVARMGILNADGFAMVEYDHAGKRVVLHRARLQQHYGVKA